MTNTGERAGDEVVQMYIRDLVSSVTRPVKELKGFAKVSVGSPARRTTVALAITPELARVLRHRHAATSSSRASSRIMVGTSSRDEDLTTVVLRVDGAHTPHS